MSGTKKLVVAVVLIVVLAGVAWFVGRSNEPAANPVANAGSASGVATPSRDAPAKEHVRRMRDPALREPLLAQIRAAKEQRLAEARSESQDATTAPADPANKEYIARSMREVEQFVAECYTQAKNRDPKLAGTVTANLTIEAEPGVGGVVGDSTIDDTSSITDPEVRECVQETMYALQLEPPAEGGVYSVRYSFMLKDGLDEAVITGPEN